MQFLVLFVLPEPKLTSEEGASFAVLLRISTDGGPLSEEIYAKAAYICPLAKTMRIFHYCGPDSALDSMLHVHQEQVLRSLHSGASSEWKWVADA